MPDSIPVAKLKREIARLKRRHKERSIDEAQLLERIAELQQVAGKNRKAAAPHLLLTFLEQARNEKEAIEEQLAPKIASLEAITRSVENGSQTGSVSKRRHQKALLSRKERMYVEDVDNFSKVANVDRDVVAGFLQKGFLAKSENDVQTAFERILRVPFHREDWGGEINDLYTSNVMVSGARCDAAFLLKGPGIGRGKELSIANCGKRGDQIMRLFESPADLYVVQYVGPIADLVIKDVKGKVAQLRADGKAASCLIMDGQDTARVLYAYGML
jgi:hypothetical protein